MAEPEPEGDWGQARRPPPSSLPLAQNRTISLPPPPPLPPAPHPRSPPQDAPAAGGSAEDMATKRTHSGLGSIIAELKSAPENLDDDDDDGE